MKPSRQYRKNSAHHADDWLMTYADLITLLLCFFAIVIITSAPKRDVPPKVEVPVTPMEKQQVSSTLPQTIQPDSRPNTLDMFPGNLPFHDVNESDPADENTPAIVPEPTEVPAPAAMVEVPSPVPTPPPTAIIPTDTTPPVGPAPFEQKGDRISTLEISSATFFDSGSAVLNQAGLPILQNVVVSLKSDKFKDYQITVEGHTDDTPIHTLQFPSNWELSTARASAVVHFFLEQGIPATRLRAAGYADTFPKAPNRDAAGVPISNNRAENRRVVIKLEKIENN